MPAPRLENLHIPAALRLPFQFDPARLHADLANVSAADWQTHFNQAIYDGDWSGVPLRASPGSHISLYSDPAAEGLWADTPLLACCAYFREVLSQFACPLLSARLLKLAPGSVIKEHRDHALGLAYGEVRLHVVVTTNPKVECHIDGQGYHWAEGECWYADFGKPHSFANRGDTERVHLVLDCTVDDWLLGLLQTSAEGSLRLAERDWSKHVEKPKSPPDIGSALDLLRQTLQHDPGLQDHLFAIHDAGEFVAALARLADATGHSATGDMLMAALRQGQRDWIERELP